MSSRNSTPYKSFKESKPFMTRKNEVYGILEKYPTKIPIILERYEKEKYLPILDKSKYLVPNEMTMSNFATIVRNRMCIGSSQALYFTVKKRKMPSMSMTITEVYNEYVDDDGYLYMTYASQEMFG